MSSNTLKRSAEKMGNENDDKLVSGTNECSSDSGEDFLTPESSPEKNVNRNVDLKENQTVPSAAKKLRFGQAVVDENDNCDGSDGSDATTISDTEDESDNGDARTISDTEDESDNGDARTISDTEDGSDGGDARTISDTEDGSDGGDARTISDTEDGSDGGDATTISDTEDGLEGESPGVGLSDNLEATPDDDDYDEEVAQITRRMKNQQLGSYFDVMQNHSLRLSGSVCLPRKNADGSGFNGPARSTPEDEDTSTSEDSDPLSNSNEDK